MNIEQAKELFYQASDNALNYHNSTEVISINSVNIILNKIFKELEVIASNKIEARKCSNCKHCDEVKERLIHCSYFEEYLPIEIGKCDIWDGKDK